MSRKTNPAFVADASQHRPPVRVRTRRITAAVSKLYPADGEGKIWWGRLKKALGTGSSDFVNALRCINCKLPLNFLVAGFPKPASTLRSR
jgi:hypothetical protein